MVIPCLSHFRYQYRTYSLVEDKRQCIILKELPEQANIAERNNKLIDIGYEVQETSKMFSRLTRRRFLMVGQKEKDIWKISHVLILKVWTERHRKLTRPGQCFKCQKYGHSQRNCHAKEKCVKCQDNHRTN